MPQASARAHAPMIPSYSEHRPSSEPNTKHAVGENMPGDTVIGIQGICKSAASVKIDTMRQVDLTFMTCGATGGTTTGPTVHMGFWEMEDASIAAGEELRS